MWIKHNSVTKVVWNAIVCMLWFRQKKYNRPKCFTMDLLKSVLSVIRWGCISNNGTKCSLWLHLKGNPFTASLWTIICRRNSLFAVICKWKLIPCKNALLSSLHLAGCSSFVYVCVLESRKKKNNIITSYINYVEWSLHVDYQIRGWAKSFVLETYCGQMGRCMLVKKLWRTLECDQNRTRWPEAKCPVSGCFLNADKPFNKPLLTSPQDHVSYLQLLVFCSGSAAVYAKHLWTGQGRFQGAITEFFFFIVA